MAETLYAILGVPERASQAEIDAAYRRAVRRHHPDTVADERQRAAKTARMASINRAADVLRDAGRRATYDADLFLARQRSVPPPPPRPAPSTPPPSRVRPQAARRAPPRPTPPPPAWTPPPPQRPSWEAPAPSSPADFADFARRMADEDHAYANSMLFYRWRWDTLGFFLHDRIGMWVALLAVFALMLGIFTAIGYRAPHEPAFGITLLLAAPIQWLANRHRYTPAAELLRWSWWTTLAFLAAVLWLFVGLGKLIEAWQASNREAS